MMQFVETSDRIDLSRWGIFDGGGSIADTMLKELATTISRLLHEELIQYPPDLDFAFSWAFGEDPDDGRGGPAPSDPVTLYLDLRLGETTDDLCSYSCSLETVVDDVIEGHCNPQTGKVENAESREICGKIAARLRELADKLDDACKSTVGTG